MVIKLQFADFELGIGVFKIRYWGFKSPIPKPKNTNPQFKITNLSIYHQLVISIFSSLMLYNPFQSPKYQSQELGTNFTGTCLKKSSSQTLNTTRHNPLPCTVLYVPLDYREHPFPT